MLKMVEKLLLQQLRYHGCSIWLQPRCILIAATMRAQCLIVAVMPCPRLEPYQLLSMWGSCFKYFLKSKFMFDILFFQSTKVPCNRQCDGCRSDACNVDPCTASRSGSVEIIGSHDGEREGSKAQHSRRLQRHGVFNRTAGNTLHSRIQGIHQ